jgi:hypothetical protein
MKFSVQIVQVYRLERECFIQIEAPTRLEAVRMLAEGEYDNPAYGDAGWAETQTLENEEASIKLTLLGA